MKQGLQHLQKKAFSQEVRLLANQTQAVPSHTIAREWGCKHWCQPFKHNEREHRPYNEL